MVSHEIIVLDQFAPIWTTHKRYVNMRGGRASAKSHHAGLRCLNWLLDGTHFQRILCVRKFFEHIEGSQFQLFKDFVEKLYPHLAQEITIHKSPFRISCKRNNNEIIFRGCDDPEKLKSITGITKVWIEEPTEIDETDLKTISMSLRGPHITDYPQILLTYNPISETHWLKARFWDNPPGNTFNHESTYLGNPFLTQADIDEIESYRETDPDYYAVIALNKWGVIKTGNEFFDQFKMNKHVVDADNFDKERAVILSFDSNNLPYSTCLAIQLSRTADQELVVDVFDEICLKPPGNTVDDIRDEFTHRHPWCNTVFYGGDPSMRANMQRKSRMEAASFEEMIEIAFSDLIHNRSNIFLRKAPPLNKRRRAMNGILSGKTATLRVNRKCVNLINDFQSLQIDNTGGYVKKKLKDRSSGARYEQGGHCMDALIYYLAKEFPDEFF